MGDVFSKTLWNKHGTSNIKLRKKHMPLWRSEISLSRKSIHVFSQKNWNLAWKMDASWLPTKTGGISCENIIIWSFGRGTPCKFRVAKLPAAEASHKKNPRMRLTRRLKRLRRCLGMSFVKKLVDVGGLWWDQIIFLGGLQCQCATSSIFQHQILETPHNIYIYTYLIVSKSPRSICMWLHVYVS